MGEIRTANATLTRADRWDQLLARCGVNRSGHRVAPGLYALGAPDAASPVFVTANYTLSFDALRSALPGLDAFILVLETEGVNIWCAAGKGTFGTDELVRRVEATGLAQVVDHRGLILPQLGAPGVAAHEVKRRCGFGIEYGPVRAADLPRYLATHQATPAMRRVTFSLHDRLVLIPVEIVHGLLPAAVVAAILYLLGGWLPAMAALAAILAGVVLFPILLPWLPGHEFSVKGFVLGGAVALPFAVAAVLGHRGAAWWQQVIAALSYLLAMPPLTAFLALNFTGSTTFTSRTGVRREIFRYVPVMAGACVAGLVLILLAALLRALGS
jgi:CO dehydrogenase/acetyl-CoA synthase delta subunit